MKFSRSAKVPNSVLYTADLAPIGKGWPTCAMTTPISPAGTWIQGNFSTLYNGHGFHLNPGINNAAWYPASPAKAIGLSLASFFAENLLVTNPTSVGPILRIENNTTKAPTKSANPANTTVKSIVAAPDIRTSPWGSHPDASGFHRSMPFSGEILGIGNSTLEDRPSKCRRG